jgi:holo-[acyl-carrier protein] synthase
VAIVGVGIDLVSIGAFAEQVDQPGTVFAETFTPGERRDAADHGKGICIGHDERINLSA